MKLLYKLSALFLSASLALTLHSVPVYGTEIEEQSSTYTEDGSSDSKSPSQTINSIESSTAAAPEIEAETAVIIDADTGVVLYDKDMNKKMYPASMTKVISAIVALNHASLTDEVEFSDTAVNSLAWDDANIGISVGETLTLKDALIGMLLPSANECANAVAEFIGGSNQGFADMMNEWAASVGANNSHFVTPSGLFDADHYTTAYDMAIMSRAAIQNSSFLSLESYSEYTIHAYSGDSSREIEVTARHEMSDEEGFIAGKTGFEDEAGHTLMTCMERNGMKLITVVMNSENYYSDTMTLMEFGFSHFSESTVGEALPSLFSSQSGSGFYSMFNSNYYPITIDPEFPIVSVNGMDSSDVTVTASYTTDGAPVRAENAIGYATFYYGELILGYAPIVKQQVQASAVPEPTTNETNGDILSVIRGLPTVLKVFCVIMLIILVVILICVIGFLALLIRKQLVRRKKQKRKAQLEARRKQRARREQLESSRILDDDDSDQFDF